MYPDPLVYELASQHRRNLEQEAAHWRLASAARVPGARLDERVLLPLADACISLGMRLRRHYRPHEATAPVLAARSSALVPIFAFQVIQSTPQRATALTYWSLMPSEQSAAGLGLVCLARPLE